MAVVRVLVVDDLAAFLRAMVSVVEETPGFEVVGAASSGEESLVVAARAAPGPRADGREPARHRRARGDPAAARSGTTRRWWCCCRPMTRTPASSSSPSPEPRRTSTKAAFGPDLLEEAWAAAVG